MAVSPHPKDSNGTVLDAKVTSLSTQASALGNGPSKFAANAELLKARIELVNHYMANGRIDPATVLSTLS